MMKNFSCRLDKLGGAGRKCACCNPFHGKSKSMLNRIVRRRLNVFFDKQNQKELSPE